MQKQKTSTWKMFWSIFRGYWCSEKKWEARGLLGLVVVLNFALVYLLVRFNTWQKEFFGMFEIADYSMFWPFIAEFAVIAFLFIFIAANSLYLQELLRLRWRIWLTKVYLEKWMNRQSYYRLQVLGSDTDNPDQRISEDVGSFARLTLELLIGFLRKLTSLVAFSLILWDLSGLLPITIGSTTINIHGYMFWACLIYCIVGTYLAHLVGQKLIPLKYDQQKYEANFRFSMMRVRENSESIAFYGGEKMELVSFGEYFGHCVTNYLKLIHRHKLLSFYTNSYDQSAALMPILMSAPRLFAGTFQIGQFMQLTHAFASVKDALSFFVSSYSTIASLAAVVQRLGLFTQHIDQAHELENGVQRACGQTPTFRVEDLTVALPDGRALMERCSLRLASGDRLLLTGPSGCGKSTFLRSIAGIWPFGQGRVEAAEGAQILFLPQRPYLPLGSLRRAICYPLQELDDARIGEVLQAVELSELASRLDDEDDWSRILSLGEQQRMAFARVLLVKPQWVFLDEATSALDEKRERAMYTLLHTRLPKTGIVSVGHRSTLFALHQTELKMTGLSWSLGPIVQAAT
ncbi:MAG: ABC transporter ATP-binding protein/permease [Desulfovibrio sp.]|nr:ABC transporter ATP-binding protein/permease [Desulfovibrio sp.]